MKTELLHPITSLIDIKNLTDAEARVAVAVALEWDFVSSWEDGKNTIIVLGVPPKGSGKIPVPDYPRDLNAAYQMEAMLSDEELSGMNEWMYFHLPNDVRLWRASARQRVNFFLAVKLLSVFPL